MTGRNNELIWGKVLGMHGFFGCESMTDSLPGRIRTETAKVKLGQAHVYLLKGAGGAFDSHPGAVHRTA